MQEIQVNIRFEKLYLTEETHLHKSPKLFLRGHTLDAMDIWLYKWTSLYFTNSSLVGITGNHYQVASSYIC